MSEMSHEFDLAEATMLPPAEPAPQRTADVEALAGQWEAVHEAAAAVGYLAQLGREQLDDEIAALPFRAAERGGARYRLVADGIDDLAAVMKPGLRALLALTTEGKDTTAAALTLWREFHTARAALIDLVDAR